MQAAQNVFKLHSEYKPTGNQPQAIDALVDGFKENLKSFSLRTQWNILCPTTINKI